MKIRMDFVTNSSSTAYVTVTIKTNKSNSTSMTYEVEDNAYGVFYEDEIHEIVSKKALESIVSGKDLLEIARQAFFSREAFDDIDLVTVYSEDEDYDVDCVDDSVIGKLNKHEIEKVLFHVGTTNDDGVEEFFVSYDYGTREYSYSPMPIEEAEPQFDNEDETEHVIDPNFDPDSNRTDAQFEKLVDVVKSLPNGVLFSKIINDSALGPFIDHREIWSEMYHPIYFLAAYLYCDEEIGKEKLKVYLQDIGCTEEEIEDIIDGAFCFKDTVES